MPNILDVRNEPSITIVDLYTKDGKHLKTTMSTEDGTVISEEGPNPRRDVYFLPDEWQQKFGQVVARKMESE